MSDTTQALQLAFDKIETLAHQYGPPTVELAARVVQMDAVGSLIIGFAILAVAVLTGFVFRCWYKQSDEYDRPIPLIVGSAAVAVLVAISCIFLLNIWNWIGVFDPKLALAQLVIAKLVS